MKEIAIGAKARLHSGRGSARRTRQNGYIPGVVYGPEIDTFGVEIKEREFHSAMKSAEGSSIINLDVEGKESKAILREIQRDPITSQIIHLDFHTVSMNKPIHVAVPIHFVGTPVGVKTDGGIMQITMRELNISCLPADIPEHIDIDVTELHIGESVHVNDIPVPKVRILSELQRTVVVIAAPTVVKADAEVTEEEIEAEAAEAAAEGEAEATPAQEEAAGKEEKKKEK